MIEEKKQFGPFPLPSVSFLFLRYIGLPHYTSAAEKHIERNLFSPFGFLHKYRPCIKIFAFDSRLSWAEVLNKECIKIIIGDDHKHIICNSFSISNFSCQGGLRGLPNIKVYFSFVYVSDSLGPSSEHNCKVCQIIKNEINGTVKDWKVKVRTGTEHLNNNYREIAQQNTGEKRGKDNIGLQIPGSESWTHKCKGQWRKNYWGAKT